MVTQWWLFKQEKRGFIGITQEKWGLNGDLTEQHGITPTNMGIEWGYYPLVVKIAIENGHRNSGFTH